MARRDLRRRAAAAAAALVTFSLALAGCAPEPVVKVDLPAQAEGVLPLDVRTQLGAAVENAMAATASSGAIAGVWAPWAGRWVEGLGADATGAAIDPGMSFRIADVTRIMTCDLLYSVAADGKVELDDSVVEHVVGIPDLVDISLLDLCNGTGGIGSYEAVVGGVWIANPSRVWDSLEISAFGLGQPRSAVGIEYRDSDAGYVLLGRALEGATGMSAAALYERYIFAPLTLESTRLPGAAPAPPGPRPLAGYRIGTNPDGSLDCASPLDVTTRSSSIGFTDSGVVSTVNDLGRYMQSVAVGAHGSGDGRWAKPLPVFPGAPAWFTATGGAYQAGSLIGQHGSLPGYLTSAYADPATGMVVVVVLNNSTASADIARSLSWELAAIASKAPPAAGFAAPEFGLPWTAAQYHDEISQTNICR